MASLRSAVLLLLLLIFAGSTNARTLQQDQGFNLGSIFNEGLAAVNTAVQGMVNGTQNAASQVANATLPGAGVTNPLQSISQALTNLTAAAGNVTGLGNATAGLPGLNTSALNGTDLVANATNTLQNIGQGVGDFLGNLTTRTIGNLTNITSGLTNITSGLTPQQGSGAAGSSGTLNPPGPLYSGGSAAVMSSLAAAAAGLLVLLQLVV